VTTLSEKDIAENEKLDSKKAKATVEEVSLEPGQASTPHRHTGPVFGYVIEGAYE
jgi:quercetin dioxygenase-like cupin family protein